MKRIGGNFNSTDETDISSPISVGSTTSVTLAAAQTVSDLIRIKVVVTNFGNQILWVKEQAASIDNDKKGIAISPGESAEVVRNGSYTGEISAIMESGGAKDVFVVIQ